MGGELDPALMAEVESALLALNTPAARLVEGGVWLVLLLPSYVMAVGWQLLLAPGGIRSIRGLASAMLRPACGVSAAARSNA